MNILYEDENIIIINKEAGILSQKSDSEPSAESLVSDYTKSPVYILHRLDRGVSGALAFAKNQRAVADVSKMIAEHRGFEKTYLAVVSGEPSDSAVLEDYLFKDSAKNKVFVVKSERKGAKFARLSYKRLASTEGLSLLSVTPETGRTHQIRVQLASRKMPICGDGKYGSRVKGNIALFSHKIRLEYPRGNEIEATATPDFAPFDIFSLK